MQNFREKKVACVIVTFNRLEKLKKALSCYEKQTLKPSLIVIINNASTDGTEEYLSLWRNITEIPSVIINEKQNLGGSGGFKAGVEEAIKHDIFAINLADDDAYPSVNYLEELFINLNKDDSIGATCSVVVDNQDNVLFEHRRNIAFRTLKYIDQTSSNELYAKPFFSINAFSFVGVLIKKEVVERIGFPSDEYFIQYDDTDYSLRIAKYYKIYCVTSTKIIHDIVLNSSNKSNYTDWKTFYSYRNRLIIIRKFGCSLLLIKEILRMILGSFKPNVSSKERRLRIQSSIAAIRNNTGKDKRYLPG